MAGLDVTTGTDKQVDDEHFKLSLTHDDSRLLIELFGELDLVGAPKLERAIARAEETSAATIVVDLSALRFMDSSGIRVLLTASKRSRAATDRLRFLRGEGQVKRALELCGVEERLPFLD